MCTVKVRIPSVLNDEMYIKAEKVIEALQNISKKYEEASTVLFTGGIISPTAIVFLNHERIFDLQQSVKDGDMIQVIFAIAGGDKSIADLNKYSKYLRQINLPQVGIQGQDKLFNAKVLLIGAGGLGTPTSMYLVGAGIGEIGIVDDDFVEYSNLARQVLYTTHSIGSRKVDCLKKELLKINRDTKINTYPQKLDQTNAEALIEKYDLVINGTDNFKTRYIVNDACVNLKKTWIDSSVLQFTGNSVTYKYGQGCYECLFPGLKDNERNCSTEGILGPICGMFGSFQATQALKHILEIDTEKENFIYYYNGLDQSFEKFKWKKRDNCPVCNKSNNQKSLVDNIEITKDEFFNYLSNTNSLIVDIGTNVGLNSLAGKPIISLDPSRIMEDFESNADHFSEYDVIVMICPYGTKSRAAAKSLQYRKHNVVSLKGGITCLFKAEEYV